MSSSSLPEKCGALDERADGMAAGPVCAVFDMVLAGVGTVAVGLVRRRGLGRGGKAGGSGVTVEAKGGRGWG
jgi:hypothetical protein